jgi:hypothetical protein
MTLNIESPHQQAPRRGLVPSMIVESVKPEEQALGNGAQDMMQGVLTQVAFVVVAQNSNVMKGTTFYVDGSFTKGFLLFAGVIVVATPLMLLVRQAKLLDEVEAGPGRHLTRPARAGGRLPIHGADRLRSCHRSISALTPPASDAGVSKIRVKVAAMAAMSTEGSCIH